MTRPPIAAIDGLRAVAVISVLLFHAGFDGFRGGFVGVDAFFVISGFLITRNLVDDLDNGRLSLAAFYVRRLARLQPALYGVLLATLTGGVLVLAPEELHHVRKATVAAAVSLANVWFWTTDDYFSPAAENNPLLHTWSLAVEEQFYLVWPLALLGLHRVSRRVMVGGIAVATIVSLGAALFFSRTAPSAVFYLTPFRVYALGAGALLALAGAPHKQWWTSSASAIGVGLLILQGTQVEGESSLLLTGVAATFATGLCILGSDSRFANAILAAPALVWLGRRSYSIYLVHWPLMVFWRLEFGRGSTVDRAGVIALSVVGGALMWLLVEQPVRLPSGAPQRHLWRSMSATVGLAASLGVFLAVLPIVDVQSPRYPDVSVTTHSPPVEVSPAQAVSTAPATGTATAGQATTGMPPPSTPPPATSGPPAEDVRLAALEDAVWRSARDNSRAIEARSAAVTMGACSFSNSDVPDGAYQVDRCAQGPADRPRYLVVGDSWAGDTFLAFSHAYPGVYFGLVSIAGCRPRLPGQFPEGELTACRNTYQFVFDHVATTDRFDGVILTGSWDQPFSDVTELALSFTGKGLRVFVVGMHARFGRSIADIILSSDSLAEVDTKARQLVEPWVHRSDTELMNGLPSSIGFIDFLGLQCPEQSCTIYSPAGALLYVDPVHLSVEGARIVGDRLRQSNPKLF